VAFGLAFGIVILVLAFGSVLAMGLPVAAALFAGCTVVISPPSRMLVGVKFVQSLTITASAVVAVTILASATLLPVLLGFAGRRVELTRWRGLVAASLVAVGMFSLGLKIVPLAALGILLALVVLARWSKTEPPGSTTSHSTNSLLDIEASTGCCANTCPKAPTSAPTPPRTSPASPAASTTDPARPSGS
jgi:hypothetical protein